jgi:tellurite methyltransferase
MDPVPDIPGFPPERCASYLQGTEGAPPRAQLLVAIGAVRSALASSDGRRPRALDVGCGPGRELVALLDAGFDVDAFDPYPDMLVRAAELLATTPHRAALKEGRVRLRLGTLESEAPRLLTSFYDVIHAGFVLPFVRPIAFNSCWHALVASLREGGVFAGQFFGPNDEFVRAAAEGDMTSHRTEEIDELFTGWDVLEREEIERDGAIGRGKAKRWHVHHVVARQRGIAEKHVGPSLGCAGGGH